MKKPISLALPEAKGTFSHDDTAKEAKGPRDTRDDQIAALKTENEALKAQIAAGPKVISNLADFVAEFNQLQGRVKAMEDEAEKRKAK